MLDDLADTEVKLAAFVEVNLFRSDFSRLLELLEIMPKQNEIFLAPTNAENNSSSFNHHFTFTLNNELL